MPADTDGRVTRPDPVRFSNDACFGGLRAEITELYARTQRRKGGVIRHALDLDKIGFCQLVLGIADAVLLRAVVG